MNAQLKIGANVDSRHINYRHLTEGPGLYSIHPSVDMVDSLFVDDAHLRGLKVFVWTVVEPEEIERLKGLGVDGMFLNNPGMLD